MAINLMEGFELQSASVLSSSNWIFGTNAPTTASKHQFTGGLGGSYSLNLGTGSNVVYSPLISTTSRWLHLAYVPPSATTSWKVEFFRSGVTNFSVTHNSITGQIELRRGGTLVATSVAAYPLGIWNYMAVEMTCLNAGGVCNVYMNNSGATAVTFSGNTRSSGTDGWDQLVWTAGGTSYLDDVVVTDNTTGKLANEPFIIALTVNGDDAGNTMSGTYTAIDELPPSTADYIEATAAGQLGFFTVTNLPYTPTAIAGVKVSNYGSRDGTITTLENAVRDGGTTYGSTHIVAAAATYALIEDIWETNPNAGGAAWSVATVNSVIIGTRYT